MNRYVLISGLLINTLILHAVGCRAQDLDGCGDLPGDQEEIARTPRPDENLELLALQFSQDITAGQTTYDQLLRDIDAIHEIEPRTRGISHRLLHDGKSILLFLDSATRRSVIEGSYVAWNCLNQYYGLVSISVPEDPLAPVQIKLKGNYNLDRLATLYAALPGIKSAEPVGSTYVDLRGPEMRVVRDRDTWHFLIASTDHSERAPDPKGSPPRTVRHFVARGSNLPQLAGTWQEAGDLASTPTWVERYWYGREGARTHAERSD